MTSVAFMGAKPTSTCYLAQSMRCIYEVASVVLSCQKLPVRGRCGPQIIFGEGNEAHVAHVTDHRTGPQRGVLAGTRVLIPTAAAAGLPNGARHVVVEVGDE